MLTERCPHPIEGRVMCGWCWRDEELRSLLRFIEGRRLLGRLDEATSAAMVEVVEAFKEGSAT